MKPLDRLSAAILDTVRGVLEQHGYAICRAADTSFPLLGADLERLLREVARNTAQAVMCVQDEQTQTEAA